MRFARIYSAQPTFLDANTISVEADLSRGLHSFSIVGLPTKAVEEARDRVSAAIKHSGFESPKTSRKKVLISLAPADLRKEGPLFDLPIAMAYLLAAEEIEFNPAGKLFLGELALDGELRPVRGILSAMSGAKKKGFTEVFVPWTNREEAALVSGVTIYPAKTLRDVVLHINKKQEEPTLLEAQEETAFVPTAQDASMDFSDIRGQEIAKRGMLIAASGRHNIVLYGPPGTGKTMLSKAFCGLLPPLSFEEALEVTAIHSVAGTLREPLITHPPFRSPHHSASHTALVGGSGAPRPGEITLAHRGVLFLDEFVEFDRRAIDALREPLEERTITISRARGSTAFPADFILVAALNPTRTHADEDPIQAAKDRELLKRKISGPIADRVDMWIEVAKIDPEKLSKRSGEHRESKQMRTHVRKARDIQHARFKSKQKTNSSMDVREIDTLVPLSLKIKTLLNTAATKMNLSPRAYHRTIKLARTIADLESKECLEENHILEALSYRPRGLFS